MARSLKKGPFIDHHLQKKVEADGSNKKSDQDLVAPFDRAPGDDRVHHRRPQRQEPARPGAGQREHGWPQARRVRLTRTFRGHGGDKKSVREMTMEAKAILRTARISRPEGPPRSPTRSAACRPSDAVNLLVSGRRPPP